MKTLEEINDIMEAIPLTHRYRWCPRTGPCACLGCVQNSTDNQITREEWELWVSDRYIQQTLDRLGELVTTHISWSATRDMVGELEDLVLDWRRRNKNMDSLSALNDYGVTADELDAILDKYARPKEK